MTKAGLPNPLIRKDTDIGNHSIVSYHLRVPRSPFLFIRKAKAGDVTYI